MFIGCSMYQGHWNPLVMETPDRQKIILWLFSFIKSTSISINLQKLVCIVAFIQCPPFLLSSIVTQGLNIISCSVRSQKYSALQRVSQKLLNYSGTKTQCIVQLHSTSFNLEVTLKETKARFSWHKNVAINMVHGSGFS